MSKLVIYPPVDDARWEKIQAAAESVHVVNAGGPDEALTEITDAEAFFGKLTPQLLQQATRLRWVQSPTASLEHYVFPELIEHPLTLTNMRGIFSDVIADQVMGYVLCFARNLHVYIRNQQTANWAPEGGEAARVAFTSGPGEVSEIDRRHQHLSDQTLGIFGLGAIGSEIARRAAAFGMRVVAVDPHADPIEPVERVWRPRQLGELLELSDYVVIAAPHTPATEGSFRKAEFERMKRTACLINIGRGAIVSLDDLVAALESGEIAGAALDVYEQEPLPPEHPLWKFPQAILTPHIAGYSPRIAARHLEVLLDNIRRFAAGEPLRNVVNKAEWY
jgi:phosphoglycerate dehydrogenase-like enzyme